MNTRAYIAEFIATFALVFVGIGSIITVGNEANGGGILTVAFAFGIALACMVSAFGHISGGHVNPAVTIGLWLTNRIRLGEALAYIVSQCVGAIVGILALQLTLGETMLKLVDYGVPKYNPDNTTLLGAVLLEAITTFFLMTVVFGTAVDRRAPKVAGLFIGLTVTFGILVSGQITGGCMNPARYLGPAVFHGDFSQAVVFFAGPILGASIAALLYHHVLIPTEEKASA